MSFLYLKAFHIMAMVAWFAGLFYLPRLFVYHADTTDVISLERFKIMERRLYYGIMWPSAFLTVFFGLWLIENNPGYYLKAGWMHAKLAVVFFLLIYHVLCGHFLKAMKKNPQTRKPVFFRVFNELPTLLLAAIILLVVVKP